MSDYPKGFPHFETEEELQVLFKEALGDPSPARLMTPDEWVRLRGELGVAPRERKLAS